MAIHGKFIPKNPQRYVGDVNKIFFRSLWESKVMKFFDTHTDIIKWGSEEISIPYLNPLDSKIHKYFPDFFVEYKDKDGNIKKEIIEVKPLHESEEKFAKTDRSKEALIVNTAKWKAASLYCSKAHLTFRVLTEKSIFYQGKKNGKNKVCTTKP